MSTSTLQEQLAQAIRQQRERSGISQEKFADQIGMHRAYYGSVERGLRNLTLRNIERIADGLGVTAAQLFAEAAKIPATKS